MERTPRRGNKKFIPLIIHQKLCPVSHPTMVAFISTPCLHFVTDPEKEDGAGITYAHLLEWSKSCPLPLTYPASAPPEPSLWLSFKMSKETCHCSMRQLLATTERSDRHFPSWLLMWNHSFLSNLSVCTWPFNKKYESLLTSLSWVRGDKSTPLL